MLLGQQVMSCRFTDDNYNFSDLQVMNRDEYVGVGDTGVQASARINARQTTADKKGRAVNTYTYATTRSVRPEHTAYGGDVRMSVSVRQGLPPEFNIYETRR